MCLFLLELTLEVLMFKHGKVWKSYSSKRSRLNDYERDLEITDLRRTVDLLQRQLEQQKNDAQSEGINMNYLGRRKIRRHLGLIMVLMMRIMTTEEKKGSQGDTKVI